MSVLDEQRLSFAAAAHLLDVHVQTIIRWAQKGVRGVKLSTCLLGGTRMTSRERLEQFIAATTGAADGAEPAPAERSRQRREKDVAAAEKRHAKLAGAPT